MSVERSDTYSLLQKSSGGLYFSDGQLFNREGELVSDPIAGDIADLTKLNADYASLAQHTRKVTRSRLHHDVQTGPDIPLDDDLHQEINELYLKTTLFLSDAADALGDISTREQFDRGPQTHREARLFTPASKLIGNVAEASFAALMYRDIKGKPTDTLLYIPASRAGDELYSKRQGTINNSFDSTVVLREANERKGDFTRVQLKASSRNKLKYEYNPETFVIALSDITHPHPPIRNYYLQKELVKDAAGEEADTEYIINVSRLFRKKIYRHIQIRTKLAKESNLNN